ncbi:MAG: hypothetical protein A2520_05905 [Deltaproteobacteria bacterium RIFOXYD12_FULL_53_23]|nr:MAG: hypothetical protein A2520_05905 [Deltaproteobacteria bacterium RIFOXYD12_FULL_53_23]
MNLAIVISTKDSENIFNAMRLANVAVKKGDEVSVFMLGQAVMYEETTTEQFNVKEQVEQFTGDFYV